MPSSPTPYPTPGSRIGRCSMLGCLRSFLSDTVTFHSSRITKKAAFSCVVIRLYWLRTMSGGRPQGVSTLFLQCAGERGFHMSGEKSPSVTTMSEGSPQGVSTLLIELISGSLLSKGSCVIILYAYLHLTPQCCGWHFFLLGFYIRVMRVYLAPGYADKAPLQGSFV